MAVNPVSGIMVVLQAEPLMPKWMATYEAQLNEYNAQARENRAKGLHKLNRELTPEEIVPRIHDTDHILVTDWRYTTAEVFSTAKKWSVKFESKTVTEHIQGLSHILFQAPTLRPASAAIVKRVLKTCSVFADDLAPAPGSTWTVGQWQFSALLALPEFEPLGWLFARYKDVFPKKMLTKVSVFGSRGANANTPNFIWYVGAVTQEYGVGGRSEVEPEK